MNQPEIDRTKEELLTHIIDRLLHIEARLMALTSKSGLTAGALNQEIYQRAMFLADDESEAVRKIYQVYQNPDNDASKDHQD